MGVHQFVINISLSFICFIFSHFLESCPRLFPGRDRRVITVSGSAGLPPFLVGVHMILVGLPDFFREEWAILGFIDFSVIGIKTMCSTDLLSMYIASPDVVIGSCLGYL